MRIKDENRSPNEREKSPNDFHLVKESLENPWTSYAALRHSYNSGTRASVGKLGKREREIKNFKIFFLFF